MVVLAVHRAEMLPGEVNGFAFSLAVPVSRIDEKLPQCLTAGTPSLNFSLSGTSSRVMIVRNEAEEVMPSRGIVKVMLLPPRKYVLAACQIIC